MTCNYCGECRFENRGQLDCHVYKNHAPFACSCFKRFTKQEGLHQHKKHMLKIEKNFKCSVCCRSFDAAESLHQHQMVKGHWTEEERKKAQEETGRFFCHDSCGRSFRSKEGLRDHEDNYRADADRNKCYECLKQFPSKDRFEQHQKDANHKNKSSPHDRRYQRVHNFYNKKVKVDPNEKKESIHDVKDTLDGIMADVRSQPGGEKFSAGLRKAGSHAANTKIGKPNEYDTNIPLAIKGTQEETKGKLDYEYIKDAKKGPANNMNIAHKIVDVPAESRKDIPMGCAVVKVTDNPTIPAHLVHNDQLIPHELKRDFYDKIKTASKNANLKVDVHVSPNAHGPAITITIKRPGKHDINVDMVPTLPCSVPVSIYGWPRPDTLRAYSEDQINAVLDAGLHLVPKGDTTWLVSHSKAETAIFLALDRGNGCRKEVMKCMKKIVMDATSKSKDGLPGVTSHLIKHALLWTSELNHQEGHWQQKNLAERLIHSMADFEYALRAGKLPNYFNTSENLLKNKDGKVLNELANYFHRERMQLIHT